ncbi:cupin domain-containing protein [Ferrimonas marina]|uniref:Cupin 2 domain-containing protein n=1 Tax=Ferrimonas marina TaxID=299255 RepID=A0A1M5NW30_9GAMM|nr:cupin domain-containing protein [Ferrimonas marina]SHG93741.1 cupin 2 domain-containing protein [Ferrimonas marina]
MAREQRPVTPLGNLWQALPSALEQEVFDTLLETGQVKIERILSQGQSSPESGWYDQDQDEWVLLLKGAAVLAFDDGQEVRLAPGDHLLIPAHCRHRVVWTDPDHQSVWIAVFFADVETAGGDPSLLRKGD